LSERLPNGQAVCYRPVETVTDVGRAAPRASVQGAQREVGQTVWLQANGCAKKDIKRLSSRGTRAISSCKQGKTGPGGGGKGE
jgi:hypothetical protein